MRRTKKEVLNWYQEHLSGVSLLFLSKKYNTDAGYHFKKQGLAVINTIPLSRTNCKNIIYNFDSVKNDTEAYMLGLIFSDGSIADNVLKLSLNKKDSYILDQIRLYVCPDAELKQDNNNVALKICSQNLCDNLRKLGKTNIKLNQSGELPNINANLYSSFIRGYFDGDGSVFLDKTYLRFNICSTNKLLLENMSKVLSSFSIKSSINKEKRTGKKYKIPSGSFIYNAKDMYRLFVRQSDSLVLLYDLLYANANMFLIRKKELFSKHVNTELT